MKIQDGAGNIKKRAYDSESDEDTREASQMFDKNEKVYVNIEKYSWENVDTKMVK